MPFIPDICCPAKKRLSAGCAGSFPWSDLEGEVIKQEGEAAEGHLGGVDGHAASSPALWCHQVGIVGEPGVSHNRAVRVHHHLP